MMRMQTSLSQGLAIILASFIVLSQPAHAQLINPFGKDAVGISEDESTRIKAAIRQVLAKYADGARADWQSADGKRAGSVVITKTYVREGRRCARIQHAFTKGPGYPFHAPLCEMATDDWRIAF